MSKKFLLSIAAVCLSLATLTDIVVGGENVSAGSKRGVKKLNIKVMPWGPTQTDVDAATQRTTSSEAVRRELSGAKFRQVGFEYIYDAAESKKMAFSSSAWGDKAEGMVRLNEEGFDYLVELSKEQQK